MGFLWVLCFLPVLGFLTEQCHHITRHGTRKCRPIHCRTPSTTLWTLYCAFCTLYMKEEVWHLMTVCLYPQHPGWKFSLLISAILPHTYIWVHMWTVWAWGAGWCRWWAGVSGSRTTENSADEHALLVLQRLGGLAVERLGVSVWGKHDECENEHHQLFRWLLHERCELRSHHGHDSRVDEWNFIRQVANDIWIYWHL